MQKLYVLLKQFDAIGGVEKTGQAAFCLLMALWRKSNELGWRNDFTMTNTEIKYRGGFGSDKTVIAARGKLIEQGFIKYAKSKKLGKCGMYILNFDLLSLNGVIESDYEEEYIEEEEVSEVPREDFNEEGLSEVACNNCDSEEYENIDEYLIEKESYVRENGESSNSENFVIGNGLEYKTENEVKPALGHFLENSAKHLPDTTLNEEVLAKSLEHLPEYLPNHVPDDLPKYAPKYLPNHLPKHDKKVNINILDYTKLYKTITDNNNNNSNNNIVSIPDEHDH